MGQQRDQQQEQQQRDQQQEQQQRDQRQPPGVYRPGDPNPPPQENQEKPKQLRTKHSPPNPTQTQQLEDPRGWQFKNTNTIPIYVQKLLKKVKNDYEKDFISQKEKLRETERKIYESLLACSKERKNLKKLDGSEFSMMTSYIDQIQNLQKQISIELDEIRDNIKRRKPITVRGGGQQRLDMMNNVESIDIALQNIESTIKDVLVEMGMINSQEDQNFDLILEVLNKQQNTIEALEEQADHLEAQSEKIEEAIKRKHTRNSNGFITNAYIAYRY